MDNKIEQYSNNGWQNIGICTIFALEQIQYSKIPLYMYLVRNSFGYYKLTTSKISQSEMAKKLNIDKKTLASHMKYLVDNNFVDIIRPNTYKTDGGSDAFAYAPDYPKGYGKVHIKDDTQKASSSGSKKQEPEKWSSENLTF